jgi:signal transduction histidine kinase
MHEEITDRNVRVEIEWSEPVPRIHVDRCQIQQAFFNVIKNAIQAMPGGGTLKISGWCSDRDAAVSFQDSGVGIAPDGFSRIFEPYYTTKADGTGLGLMIVQRIVQDHGGHIEVHSEPNAGTTFVILLPLDERRVRLLEAARPDEGENREGG